MLIIKPIQTKELQRALCEQCGVQYRQDALCYQAHLGETPDAEDIFIGICQFELGKIGIIRDLICAPGIDDEEALFIMGRQTLNFMDLCGTHEAEFRPASETSEHLIRWLGFRQRDDRWYMDLHGVFDKHKHDAQNPVSETEPK